MLIWLIITITLAFFGVVELLLNFTMPFMELRVVLLFLLILGMAYRLHLMEKGGEKEKLKGRIRALEDTIREREFGGSWADS